MRAAILCPGPSLTKTWRADEHFDVRIAVNRAILHATCEWWSAADWTMLKEVEGKPTHGICTQDDAVRFILDGKLISKERTPPAIIGWSALPYANPGYSTVAAISLAAYLGAKKVLIFGDDKSGSLDWDGVPAGKNRGDERWTKEKQVMNKAMLALGLSHLLHVIQVRP